MDDYLKNIPETQPPPPPSFSSSSSSDNTELPGSQPLSQQHEVQTQSQNQADDSHHQEQIWHCLTQARFDHLAQLPTPSSNTHVHVAINNNRVVCVASSSMEEIKLAVQSAMLESGLHAGLPVFGANTVWMLLNRQGVYFLKSSIVPPDCYRMKIWVRDHLLLNNSSGWADICFADAINSTRWQ